MEFICAYCKKPIREVTKVVDGVDIVHSQCEALYHQNKVNNEDDSDDESYNEIYNDIVAL